MLKKSIKKILERIGYELHPKSKQHDYALQHAPEFKESYQIVESYTMLSYLKLATLFEKVVHCEQHNIKGDFVECGVWKGGAVGVMAMANQKYSNTPRNIHLFDAFDDICEPDPNIDGQQAVQDVEELLGKEAKNLSGKLNPIKGIYDSRGGHGTIEGCKALLINKIKYNSDYLFFHKGWFQDSLPATYEKINQIAILRLDADWYSSTKICLDYLYDKVVKGGFVIIDDYGRYDGCKKAVDDFLSERNLSIFLHYSNHKAGECRYFIKP